jgi:hypothetical protein
MGGAATIQRFSESPAATQPVPAELSTWNHVYPSASLGPPATTALVSLLSAATVSAAVPGASLTRTASATTWIVVPMAYGDPVDADGDGSTDGDASAVGGEDGPAG